MCPVSIIYKLHVGESIKTTRLESFMAVNHYKLTEITTIVTVLHVIIFDLNCAYTESFFFFGDAW